MRSSCKIHDDCCLILCFLQSSNRALWIPLRWCVGFYTFLVCNVLLSTSFEVLFGKLDLSWIFLPCSKHLLKWDPIISGICTLFKTSTNSIPLTYVKLTPPPCWHTMDVQNWANLNKLASALMIVTVHTFTIVVESDNIYNSDAMKKMEGLKYMFGYFHEMK